MHAFPLHDTPPLDYHGRVLVPFPALLRGYVPSLREATQYTDLCLTWHVGVAFEPGDSTRYALALAITHLSPDDPWIVTCARRQGGAMQGALYGEPVVLTIPRYGSYAVTAESLLPLAGGNDWTAVVLVWCLAHLLSPLTG
jgi:hypothetical protein